jgi:hypothetical protein
VSYTAYGPFNNGSAPGISSAFLNALEAYLTTINNAATDANISSDGSGDLTIAKMLLATGSVNRIAKAGPLSVTTTLTFFNHNLGAVPDFVIPVISAGSTTAHNCYVDFGTMTSTQVKLQADGSLTVYILSIKF